VRITDRKKDLIKMAGGKYIEPQAIEVVFKAVCPLASQMLVHAEQRKYVTALITLDPDALAQWGRAQGLTASGYSALAANPAVRRFVQFCMEELNGWLSRWETVKDFRILDQDLSGEEGELTPSPNVKRKVVETKYEPVLDSIYCGRPLGLTRRVIPNDLQWL
jgi:long-chain acyl-CoA synthetase